MNSASSVLRLLYIYAGIAMLRWSSGHEIWFWNPCNQCIFNIERGWVGFCLVLGVIFSWELMSKIGCNCRVWIRHLILPHIVTQCLTSFLWQQACEKSTINFRKRHIFNFTADHLVRFWAWSQSMVETIFACLSRPWNMIKSGITSSSRTMILRSFINVQATEFHPRMPIHWGWKQMLLLRLCGTSWEHGQNNMLIQNVNLILIPITTRFWTRLQQ